MYLINNFNQQMTLTVKQWVGKKYPTISAELQAIATGLTTDTTTHSRAVEKAPAALAIGAAQTAFTNGALHIVDKGKAGNLTNTAMSNAITALLGAALPPANTTAPAVTGTGAVGNTLSCTTGIWTLSPTSYAYQWMRNGADIIGATASTYKLVAADSTHSIACMVTAFTAGGSASVASNAVACA
jgi:hypothetical protein